MVTVEGQLAPAPDKLNILARDNRMVTLVMGIAAALSRAGPISYTSSDNEGFWVEPARHEQPSLRELTLPDRRGRSSLRAPVDRFRQRSRVRPFPGSLD